VQLEGKKNKGERGEHLEKEKKKGGGGGNIKIKREGLVFGAGTQMAGKRIQDVAEEYKEKNRPARGNRPLKKRVKQIVFQGDAPARGRQGGVAVGVKGGVTPTKPQESRRKKKKSRQFERKSKKRGVKQPNCQIDQDKMSRKQSQSCKTNTGGRRKKK